MRTKKYYLRNDETKNLVSSFFIWCRNFAPKFVQNAQLKNAINGRKYQIIVKTATHFGRTINFEYKINQIQNYIFSLDTAKAKCEKALKNKGF